MRSTSRYAQLLVAVSLGRGEEYAAQLSRAGVLNAAWWLFGAENGCATKHEAVAFAQGVLASATAREAKAAKPRARKVKAAIVTPAPKARKAIAPPVVVDGPSHSVINARMTRAREVEATLAKSASWYLARLIDHHENLNNAVGRDHAESRTLKLAKAALAAL